jgi:hypothetical protein
VATVLRSSFSMPPEVGAGMRRSQTASTAESGPGLPAGSVGEAEGGCPLLPYGAKLMASEDLLEGRMIEIG